MSEAKPILMPKLGQTVEECAIVKWHKSEGDQISKGDVIFEIETDKAILESEAFSDGTLLKIVVPEGKTVPVQSTVAFIGEPGDTIPEIKCPPKPAKKEPEKPAKKSLPPAVSGTSVAPAQVQPVVDIPAPPDRKLISPRARKLCHDKLIAFNTITGSGPGGRVVEKDVVAYLDERGYDDIRISPTAKNLAEEEKLDILEICGSGEGGKIMVADCKRAIKEKPRQMSKMRQVISERLTQSFRNIPHFFVTISVDMTALNNQRRKLKESAEGTAHSVTDYVMMAVTAALKKHDSVNSMTPDGKSVKWNSRVHLGIAVALDNGLVVPVIRNADSMDIGEMHTVAKELVVKARDGKLTPEEMSGSTFTISNMGMLGVDQFTAIINPGESAILAVASTKPTPVVIDGEIAVRDIMKITLSADHRVIDGAKALEFMNTIKSKLEI